MAKEKQLRRTEPSCYDVLGHGCFVELVAVLVLMEAASKTKIANLELTITVDKNVARLWSRSKEERVCLAWVDPSCLLSVQHQFSYLQITVEHLRRVDVLETTQELVQEVLNMLCRKLLLAANDLL
jgi:hypothetical protein